MTHTSLHMMYVYVTIFVQYHRVGQTKFTVYHHKVSILRVGGAGGHYSDFRYPCSISWSHRPCPPIRALAIEERVGFQGTVYLLYCIRNLEKFCKSMRVVTINYEFRLPCLIMSRLYRHFSVGLVQEYIIKERREYWTSSWMCVENHALGMLIIWRPLILQIHYTV